jgi:hypothetical protein
MIYFKKTKSRREKVNFLLRNKYYQRLHLILYLLSVFLIVLVYFLTLIIFSNYVNFFLTSFASIVIGISLVYNRDKLVKLIDDYIQDLKIRRSKQKEKESLSKTLKKIAPKNNRIKLNIKGKVTISEKLKKLTKNFSFKKKNKEEYIEIDN